MKRINQGINKLTKLLIKRSEKLKKRVSLVKSRENEYHQA